MINIGVLANAGRRLRCTWACLGWQNLKFGRTRSLAHIAKLFVVYWAASFSLIGTACAAAPMMALGGQSNVDALGGFTYSVPLKLPPGTNGLVPHLALTYSSHSGDGYVGLGWRVTGLSAITRCPETWAQDGQPGGVTYSANDRFCLDGQRLIVVNGAYGANGSEYRTEIESFRKIVRHTTGTNCGVSCFDVWTKDGTHYQYGYTANSDGNASNAQVLAGSAVRVWAINQVTETKGNYISYTYTNVGGNFQEYVPNNIYYTGNAGSGGNSTYNHVHFVYTTRPDIVPAYQAGQQTKPQKLLTHIETYHLSAQLILDYQLSYVNQPPTFSHNELTQIKLCDSSQTNCLAPMTFGWQGSQNNPAISTAANGLACCGAWVSFADINGDGLMDAIVQNASPCPADGVIYYGSQGGTSFTSANIQATWDKYYLDSTQTYRYTGVACFLNSHSQPAVPADIDGDGISDLAIDVDAYKYTCINGQCHWSVEDSGEILKNYGTQLTQVSQDGFFGIPSMLTRASSGFPADFNNDGRADAIANGYEQFSNGVSNGSLSLTQGPAVPNGQWFDDFDGDGCTDFFYQNGSASGITFSSTCNPAVASATVPNFNGDQLVFGDFNGDGKVDVIDVASTGAKVYLSTGAGLVYQYTISNSTNWAGSFTVVTGDWNGDGKTDLALVPTTRGEVEVFYSTGTGFTQSQPLYGEIDSGCSPVVADLNNDGAADVWVQCASGATEVLFSYTPELMNSVSNGIGATTSITYDRLNHATIYTKGSGAAYPMQDVDSPVYAVSNVQVTGAGTTRSWSYTYSGLEKDLYGRGLLGFQQIKTTDQQTGVVRTVDYGSGGAAGMQFPYNALVYSDITTSGATTLKSVVNTWKLNDNTYCPNENNNVNAVVCLEQTVVSGTDLDGVHNWPTTTTTFTYDGYGNILTKRTSVSSGGNTFTSQITNTWNYDQNNGNWIMDEPATSKTENTVPNSDITRQYAFSEKNGDTGEITEVDVEPENEQNQDSTWLIANYGYDNWGNLSSTTNSGWSITTRTSSLGYDSNGEFPNLVTNALGQTETPAGAQYWGGLASFKDLNNNTTTWSRDTFGRPLTTTRVDGTTVNTSEYYCSGVNGGGSPYTCPSAAAFVLVTQYQGAPVNGVTTQNAPTTLAFYDALGRVVAADKQAFDGNWNQTDTEYDSLGNVSATSKPYETALSTAQCPTGSVCTTYTRDILGRAKEADYPNDAGGTSKITYSYNALTTSVTNDLGQTTTTTKNVQGLVSNVVDANNKTTTYTYDAFGDVLTVSTPKNANQIVNTFDIRGRKTSSADLDKGYWQYGYDSLGELLSQISPNESANAAETTLGYDVLGRIINRSEPDMYSTWEYDQATNGIGLIDKATCGPAQNQQQTTIDACVSGGYTRSYFYDGFSRPKKVQITSPMGTYSSTETYDDTTGTGTELLANVTTFSGFQYSDHYNSVGYMSQITDTLSGTPYWSANSMDASDHLTQETAGSGVVTNRAYWPESGRIEQIYAQSGGAPGTDLANLSYSWDSIGNLVTRDDTVNGVAENFCYLDNSTNTANVLNRLSNYSVNSPDNSCSDGANAKSMSYDADGNIASRSDVGTFNYSGVSAGPHAVTSIASCSGCNVNGQTNPTFSYDSDGNMVSDAGRQLSYTSFDMMASVSQGTNTTSFAYDPEHNRASNTNSVTGNTTWYLNNPAAGVLSDALVGSSTTWHDYLSAYGHIVAERFTTGWTASMSYFVVDHLASTTELSDASQNQQEYDSYDSWGKRRNVDGTDRSGCLSIHPNSITLRGYTGQEELDSYCLVNLNARLYDPSIGRMLSADSMVPDTLSGQSYNRYSYVDNNPLEFADPTGHCYLCDVALWGGNGTGYDGGGAGMGDGSSDSGGGGANETVVAWGTAPNSWADPNWAAGQFDLEQFMRDAQQVGGSAGGESGVETVVVTANRITNAITAMNNFNLQFLMNSFQSMSFGVGDPADTDHPQQNVCNKSAVSAGRWLAAKGAIVSRSGNMVLAMSVPAGLVPGGQGLAAAGGVVGLTFDTMGLGMIDLGMLAMYEGGDSQDAAQVGLSALISAFEPEISSAAPSDPADATAAASVNAAENEAGGGANQCQ